MEILNSYDGHPDELNLHQHGSDMALTIIKYPKSVHTHRSARFAGVKEMEKKIHDHLFPR